MISSAAAMLLTLLVPGQAMTLFSENMATMPFGEAPETTPYVVAMAMILFMVDREMTAGM